MKIRRTSGTLLIAIGVIHSLFTFIVFAPFLAEMLANGVINSVHDEPKSLFAVHWFALSGYFWIIAGYLVNYVEKATDQPLPQRFGVLFIVFGLVAVVFEPISGAWTFVAYGIYVVFRARRAERIGNES